MPLRVFWKCVESEVEESNVQRQGLSKLCVCVCVCSRAKRVIKGVALRSLVSVLRALEVTFVTV